jgi:hypothetical protein
VVSLLGAVGSEGDLNDGVLGAAKLPFAEHPQWVPKAADRCCCGGTPGNSGASANNSLHHVFANPMQPAAEIRVCLDRGIILRPNSQSPMRDENSQVVNQEGA